MGWDSVDVAKERPRLQALADFKYDEYQQFAPGERFVESLALWLSQFEAGAERRVAYDFVVSKVVFVSVAEMNHFVAMAFPDHVRQHLVRMAARATGIQPWRAPAIVQSDAYRIERRRCLVLGLSDGARLDVFRRFTPELSHEQIFATYELPEERLSGVRGELDKALAGFDAALRGPSGTFSTIVLLDDFAGSGLSFVRREGDRLTGKFVKIIEGIVKNRTGLSRIVDRASLRIVVVYYVASSHAKRHLAVALQDLSQLYGIDLALEIVHELPDSIVHTRDDGQPVNDLLARYYTSEIEDEHSRKGKTDLMFGFAGCGLPVVLSHNTPNNSLFLLWAQRGSLRALFPRVSRHVARASDIADEHEL